MRATAHSEDAGTLGVSEQRVGAVAVVTLHGEHDVSTVDEVRARVIAAIAAAPAVVVDLRAATFVDSSVLGALVVAHRSATERDVGFTLAVRDEGDDVVRTTLARSGLDAILPVYGSRSAAVAAAAPA
jgi:anti-sigma B factor antagonist